MCDHNHSSATNSGACCQHSRVSSVHQTLDELDFERGIWGAVQNSDIERVRKLLASGTPVDQVDAAGYTALHYAVRMGNEEMVSELLRAGADINAKTRAGQATPLHRATSAGHSGIIDLLLARNADTNAIDADGKTVLHRAAETQKKEICKKFMNRNSEILNVADNRGKFAIDYVKLNDYELREIFSN